MSHLNYQRARDNRRKLSGKPSTGGGMSVAWLKAQKAAKS